MSQGRTGNRRALLIADTMTLCLRPTARSLIRYRDKESPVAGFSTASDRGSLGLTRNTGGPDNAAKSGTPRGR
jgi:hypothetical protein